MTNVAIGQYLLFLRVSLDKGLGAILPGWRANRCFGRVDANHDGEISGAEIEALLQYLRSHGYGK